MNRHESYKKSEIDWVGEIPSHWETVKPKYRLNRVTRPIEDGDEIVTCFRDGVVTLRRNRREDGFTNSIKEHGYQQIKPGDLVVHEMDGFAGAIGISDSKGKSTPVYTVVEPDHRVDLRYFSHLLHEMSKTGKIESLARSIRERTTDFRWNMWSEIYFPFPPIEEQKLISRYLDKKTKQIDRLVEKIQNKIELLKEQRISLINQCVTKGLDPNVEMKNSGVEWIGEIPSGWNVKKLKYIGDLYGGLTGKSGNDFNNEENPNNKPFIPFTNIFNNVYISDKHFQYVNIEPNERQNKAMKNDLFFLMSSEGYDDLGKSSILISEIDELYLNSFCKGYRINNDNVNPLFINYQLLGNTHRKLISIEGKGFTRINLRQDKLKNTYMYIPPLQEQQQIVDYLDKETTKIDKIINIESKRIVLLKEYRQSLISSVVTGKVRVAVDML